MQTGFPQILQLDPHCNIFLQEIQNAWRFVRLEVFTAVTMKTGVF
jgi:hypothetical protein